MASYGSAAAVGTNCAPAATGGARFGGGNDMPDGGVAEESAAHTNGAGAAAADGADAATLANCAPHSVQNFWPG